MERNGFFRKSGLPQAGLVLVLPDSEDSMIRLILVAFLLFGFLIASIPHILWMKRKGRLSECSVQNHALQVVQAMFRMILRVSGVKLEIRGRENIPDQAVLFVGNHRSYFDILAGYVSVPGRMGFVAKKEMERYPLLSDWMVAVNCLFLDRENIKEGLKTILEGIEKVKNGISIWIFPEGTRNGHEDLLDLLPFKEGSLKIAEKSGCPVVPVAITGTAEVFEKHIPWIRPSKVTIEFGRPFYMKELSPEDRKRAGAYTRQRILEMLTEEKQREGKK